MSSHQQNLAFVLMYFCIKLFEENPLNAQQSLASYIFPNLFNNFNSAWAFLYDPLYTYGKPFNNLNT